MGAILSRSNVNAIDLSKVIQQDDIAVQQLLQSLRTKSYAVLRLDDEEIQHPLQSFRQSVHQYFADKTDSEKEALSLEDGNIGYVQTKTREFLKLRHSDFDAIESIASEIDSENGRKTFDITAEITWNIFNHVNNVTVEHKLTNDVLVDIHQCLQERASISVVHYYPATISEQTSHAEFVTNNETATDACKHGNHTKITCSKHQDTGIMTLIVTGDVPGLEVFDLELNSWIPLEKMIQPLRKGNTEIMVVLLGLKASMFFGNQYQATLHRVAVSEGVERPSFLYFMDTAKVS